MSQYAAGRLAAAAAAVAFLTAAVGCGGTLREAEVGGVASIERGMESFNRGDWIDAIADLKAFVEQYPGTDRTDDALFYLGEAHFQLKDYPLASGQYDRLIRDFPASPLHPQALFQLALCDELQAHPAPLDQTETARAISRYKDFLELYPEDARAQEAREHLKSLNDRLAEKRWRNGKLYAQLKHYEAAVYYLRGMITEYPDSRWTGEARLLLADVLIRQGYSEAAAATLRDVEQSTASPDVKSRAQARLRELEGRRSTP